MNTQVIQVDYDDLHQVATRFNSAAQQIEQTYQITNRAFQQLENGGWVGRGANAFIDEMRGEVFPAVQRLAQALAEAGLTTQQIVQILQQADEQAAHPFDSGVSDGGYGLPKAWSGIGRNSPWPGFLGSNYNDYGIPYDWLSSGSGGGTAVNNWGIPNDWLGDISSGLGQDITTTPTSGGSVGNSSGGGGLEAGTGNELTENEPLMPSGSSGGGNTAPETIIRDPYGSDTGSRDFSNSQTISDSSSRFRYEAVSSSPGIGSSGVESMANTTPSSQDIAAPTGGTPEAGNNKATGIPFGIMAASPFMALLGKMVVNKDDER